MGIRLCRKKPEAYIIGTDLIKVLSTGKKSGVFDIRNEEITSMLLIAVAFGLINTLVQEKLEDEQMQVMLIENHVEILVRGVSKY